MGERGGHAGRGSAVVHRARRSETQLHEEPVMVHICSLGGATRTGEWWKARVGREEARRRWGG